jgi:hypothetical protein
MGEIEEKPVNSHPLTYIEGVVHFLRLFDSPNSMMAYLYFNGVRFLILERTFNFRFSSFLVLLWTCGSEFGSFFNLTKP